MLLLSLVQKGESDVEILRCENVRKVYGSGNNQVVALDHIDLSVQKGEFVAIVGASGSGKSTLLHILGSVDKPTEGKVVIEGTDISRMNRTQAAIFRRRKVGLIYQFYNLIPTLTVRKNILMPLTLDKQKPNQDAWDVMATVKDTPIEAFTHEDEIHGLDDTDSIIYQKAEAYSSVPMEAISKEVENLGGVEALAGTSVSAADDTYTIQAPLVIMDDSSFAAYCEQIGVSPSGTGSVILNRIWDSANSNFRYKEYVPFLTEEQDTIILQNRDDATVTVTIPVLGYTQKPPVLREEYDNYALVQFLSVSSWKQIEKVIGNAEQDTYIRVLATKDRTLTELNTIEMELTNILENELTLEMENRVQEKIDNDAMLNGYKLIIGALCALLALIGIANVFSNTLGFIRQRKREFARYMSIGMTPEGMRKIFRIEALVIAGRPVLITLPVTVLFVWFMITASYLNPMEFLSVAPIVPIAIFIAAIFGFVALAYYVGGKKILKCNLVEALQSDYMG